MIKKWITRVSRWAHRSCVGPFGHFSYSEKYFHNMYQSNCSSGIIWLKAINFWLWISLNFAALLLAAYTQRYKRAGKSIYYFSLLFHQLSIQKSNSVVELHHNDYSGTTILSKLEISYLQCLLFCLGKTLNFRTSAYIWNWNCQGIILEFKWILGC